MRTGPDRHGRSDGLEVEVVPRVGELLYKGPCTVEELGLSCYGESVNA